MARINKKILKGLRGRACGLVFKVRDGKAYVSAAPIYDKNRPLSPAQIKAREKFTLRTRMAKQLLSDPEIERMYEEAAGPMQSAYNIAIRDISHSREVLDIQSDDYKGIPGEKILIEAVDDFKVKSVMVTITSAGNKIIEQGEAVLLDNNIHWLYTVQKRNRKVEGCIISVTATDIPGNSGTLDTVVTREC